MKMLMLGAGIALWTGFISCNNQNHTNSKSQTIDTVHQTNDMKNLVSIIEIPTVDFSRAVTFYQEILGLTIELVEMDGIKMGLFPNAGENVSVQLINGSDYKPSSDGTIIYLNGGDDLQKIADRIEASGGKILVPKTEISPDIGFFAMFIDSEGNKLGLHSYK